MEKKMEAAIGFPPQAKRPFVWIGPEGGSSCCGSCQQSRGSALSAEASASCEPRWVALSARPASKDYQTEYKAATETRDAKKAGLAGTAIAVIA